MWLLNGILWSSCRNLPEALITRSCLDLPNQKLQVIYALHVSEWITYSFGTVDCPITALSSLLPCGSFLFHHCWYNMYSCPLHWRRSSVSALPNMVVLCGMEDLKYDSKTEKLDFQIYLISINLYCVMWLWLPQGPACWLVFWNSGRKKHD